MPPRMPTYVNRYWRLLLQVDRVSKQLRAGFAHRSRRPLAERLQREFQLDLPDHVPGPMAIQFNDRGPGGDQSLSAD